MVNATPNPLAHSSQPTPVGAQVLGGASATQNTAPVMPSPVSPSTQSSSGPAAAMPGVGSGLKSVGGSGAGNDPFKGLKPAKKPNRRSMLVAVGVLAFVILGGGALFVSRLFQTQDSFAPTLPQAAPAQSNSCTLSWTIAETPLPQTCIKKAYRDELSNTAGSYQLLQEQTQFAPGDVVVYAITYPAELANEKIILTDVVNSNLTFMDSNCGAGAYISSTNTLSCQLSSSLTQVIFRARVSSAIASTTTIPNLANMAAGGEPVTSCQVTINVTPGATPQPTPSPTPSPTPGVTPSPSPTPTPGPVSCGSSCTSTDQCYSGHTCSDGRCVYNPCLDTANYTCDSTRCAIIPDTTRTTVGCNQVCSTNSDCAASNHFCYYGRCRLDINPNSEYCSIDQSQPVPTPIVYSQTQTVVAPTTSQPVLPAELPQTGTGDTLKILLGAGGLLLLGGIMFLL